MLYDCFPFFNELDLLEIRLHELDSVVDRFVLVEASKTFQNNPKPLYFQENKQRFEAFLDKIDHIVVDNFPGFFYKFRKPKAWDNSNYQKDQIVRGLKHCSPRDVIIFSDVDEIPKASKISQYKDEPGVKVFQQKFSNFYLNCVSVDSPNEDHLLKKDGFVYWRGSVMLSFEDFSSAREARLMRNDQGPDIIQIEEGGWHFSFLGGWENVLYKLQNWEHAREENYTVDQYETVDQLKEKIDKGEDLFDRAFKYKFVHLDETFPPYVLDNEEKFTAYLKKI